jgi:hypothetical protein
MLKRRSRRHALVIGFLSIAAVAVVAAATSNAASKEIKLHGHMVNIQNFFAPDCTSVTGICSRFTAKGDIKGEGVVFIDTAPSPDPISFSKAHTVIHTKKGDLTCTEAALFDFPGADHAFVDLCVITGGTGKYAGATGYIQEVGTFDFASNQGQLEYFGKLVLAD